MVMTTTNELFLPSRITYRVHDADGLVAIFKKLQCMIWEVPKQRWTWNYEHEAKAMGFPAAYDAIPPEHQPVVLASCYLMDSDTLHVYVRSTFRLIKTLVFFGQQVPLSCAKGEFFDEYNFVTKVKPGQPLPYPEDFFKDESKIEFIDPDKFLGQGKEAAMAAMLDMTSRYLPALERHSLEAFYTDGVAHFVNAMRLREILAMEQDKRVKPIRPYEVILELVQKAGNNPPW